MSIQKKSLISALKTTKKANVASVSTEGVKGEKQSSMAGGKVFRTGGVKHMRTGGVKHMRTGGLKHTT